MNLSFFNNSESNKSPLLSSSFILSLIALSKYLLYLAVAIFEIQTT